MRTLLTVLALCAASQMLSAQVIDGVNLADKKDLDYIEILGVNQGVFKQKLVIVVDYGQKIKAFESDTRVEGADGKPIEFNSMMDAVNRFSAWGWELQTTYALSVGNNGSVLHYVFKRKK